MLWKESGTSASNVDLPTSFGSELNSSNAIGTASYDPNFEEMGLMCDHFSSKTTWGNQILCAV